MKNQIRNMFTSFTKLGGIAFFASAMLVLVSAGSASASLTFGVTFGTAQENNGPCVGKGVCKESLNDMDPNTLIYASNPEAVSVTFQISPEDSTVLMMSFLMSELKAKQPDQSTYFTDGGSYSFDLPAGFIFPNGGASTGNSSDSTGTTNTTNTATANQLIFPANATISSSSPTTVAISGDIVTIYISLVPSTATSNGGGAGN